MRWIGLTFVMLGLLSQRCWSEETPPRSLDASMKIELFAELRPTGSPTGLDLDELGRVWVVESQAAEGDEGRATDRILVLSDTDADGKADKTDVFVDGLEHATSVAVRPAWLPTKASDGQPAPRRSVYVATKDALLWLHDDDDDNQADRRDVLVRVQTMADAPHLGFHGLAFDPLGCLVFGFSGPRQDDYQLIGADSKILPGITGNGGSLYRCRNDGTHLSLVATGFDYAQSICLDGFGRLFAVDRHGDGHRSGRLLHVIPGGDYGYRSGDLNQARHPFTSWSGEIPGTLPMVAPTGLSPVGVVAFESDGLPEEYLGNLLVTSVGGHRIDRFRLNSRGTSFTSSAEAMIVGGDSFRPVGIACAPNGSLFCTDQGATNESHNGQRRIWIIAAVEPHQRRTRASDVESISSEELLKALTDHRLFVRRLAARKLASSPDALTMARQDSRLPGQFTLSPGIALGDLHQESRR